MFLTDSDLQAIWLTVRLAGIVTLTLLLLGTPIAWWLARSKAWWKGPIGAVVALPLVLPPSVLGYVFQEASLFPHLTVMGNLRYGLKRFMSAIRRTKWRGWQTTLWSWTQAVRWRQGR